MKGQPTLHDDFIRAEDYYFKGRLQDAANLCKDILDKDPQFAHGYYLMGALFKSTGNFEKAVHFSDLAIKFNSSVANFHLQRGHSLLCMGRNADAQPALEEALRLDAKLPVACLLLGNIATKEQRYADAIACFKKGLAAEEIPELYEHMGLCYQMQGNHAEAEKCFSRLVTLNPGYAQGHLNLGRLLADKGDFVHAEEVFERAHAADNSSHEALIFLAKMRETNDKITQAAEAALMATRLKPPTVAPYLYAANLLMKLSSYEYVLEVYRGALEIDPEHVVALKGYTNMLIQTNNIPEALIYIDRQLARNPDDIAMNYFKAAFTGQKPETAPPDYVAKLFDEYAERFDKHLQGNLSYNTPQLLAGAVLEVLRAGGGKSGDLSLLDLGCGTGLGAEALRAITGFRVGVDLSPKMIEKSKEKNIYNETAVGEIAEYMEQTSRRFDLVIAVDVLVYIGNLEAVFAGAAKAVAPGGLFAISVEGGDDSPPYVLRVTARYGHAKDYLLELAERYGFDVKYIQSAIIRHEKDVPLQGYVAVFCKRVAH